MTEAATPKRLEQLQRLPLFAGLDSDLLQQLAADFTPKQFAAGETIIRQGEPADELILLLSGEAQVIRQERLQAMIAGPELIGLLALLESTPRSADVRCWSDCQTLHLSQQRFDQYLEQNSSLSRNLMKLLVTQLSQQYDTSFRASKSFDDLFTSPNAQLVPGPYEFDPFPVYLFVLEHEPAHLQSLLPPGVKLIPGMGGRYIVLVSQIERCYTDNAIGDGRQFGYHETTPFIPCVHQNQRFGSYIPELYPDAYLPIILGREMYGFPKRYGQTDIGQQHIDLILADRLLFRARWRQRQDLSSEAYAEQLLQAMLPENYLSRTLSQVSGKAFAALNSSEFLRRFGQQHVFVRRQLLGEQSLRERHWRIDELVEIPFQVQQVSEFARLEHAEFEFFDPGHFLGGRCLAGFAARLGFSFGKGHIREDYLPEKAPDLSQLLARLNPLSRL